MFHIGQRWYSEAEPELGLGIITEVESKIIQILYPEAQDIRSYGTKTAPLKRFLLEADEIIETTDGVCSKIISVHEQENLIFYKTETDFISETKIKAQIKISGPIDRLHVQNYDSPQFFNLRYNAYLAYRNYQLFKLKGFLGAKINLIPHQIYLSDDILEMASPKVMLCDEVGLGKTIEASLVMHSLVQRELVTNTLIIVPDSLTNQWFVELYKKFSLSFEALSEGHAINFDLEKSQRYIVSRTLLETNDELAKKINETPWDMLIVDESHQIRFFEPDNKIANIVRDISLKTYSTLLLSATPEVMGIENLYYQLNLLDPQRYNNLESFKSDHERFQKVSTFIKNYRSDEHSLEELNDFISTEEQSTLTTKEQIIQRIVDRYGAGRNYFRNSRSHLEKYGKLFTKRKNIPYPIKLAGKIDDTKVLKVKVEKLHEVLKEIKENKIFVICHSKEIIIKISRKLLDIDNFKIAQFHSEQSLLERDRQAAYFADPQGAQILLSTEVGSEGRNFEFAHHMFLFDLPKLPDQLEQRIGRLDRIGQLNDIIIHTPYIQDTFEQTLFDWYSDVLGAFTQFPKGGNNFYQIHQSKLKDLLTNQYDSLKNKEILGALKDEFKSYQEYNEAGRDTLLETRSFNPNKANELIKYIRDYEQNSSCRDFLTATFNEIGIDFEELNQSSFFVKPSHNMLIPSYPGLLSDGMSITFEREYANHHQNIDLVSWEHPLVKTAFDLILNSPLGNFSIIVTDELPRDVYFEFILTLQCSDQFKYLSCSYLPFTPLRVLINVKGEDLTRQISKKEIDAIQFQVPSNDLLQLIKTIPKETTKSLAEKAFNVATKRSEKYKSKALSEVNSHFTSEKNRVLSIVKDEKIKKISLDAIDKQCEQFTKSINEAKIELDSLRVILPQD